MRRWIVLLIVLISGSLANGRAPELAWPQFRGPSGAGILTDGKLPTSWSSKDNIRWSVEVNGRGWNWRKTALMR